MGINLLNEARWLWKQTTKAAKPAVDRAAKTVSGVVSQAQASRASALASHAEVRRNQQAARSRDIAPERHNPVQRTVLNLLDQAGNLGNGYLATQERFLKEAGDRAVKLAGSLPVVGGVAGTVVRGHVRNATMLNEFSQGVVKGIGNNVGGLLAAAATPKKTALGLVDLAAHLPVPANPVRLAQEVFRAKQAGGDVRAAMAYALDPVRTLQDDQAFFKAVGQGLTASYNESWRQGRYAEAVGKLTLDIVSVVGTGGGGAATKTGKALDAVSDVASVGHKALGAVDDAARQAGGLAGSADDAFRGANRVDDALKGASDKLQNATDVGDKVANREE